MGWYSTTLIGLGGGPYSNLSPPWRGSHLLPYPYLATRGAILLLEGYLAYLASRLCKTARGGGGGGGGGVFFVCVDDGEEGDGAPFKESIAATAASSSATSGSAELPSE